MTLEVKLNWPFCRTGALLQPDTGPRVELLANLLYLYDESWRLEGGRIVVGSTARSAQPSGDQEGGLAKPMKKLKKWLALAELGHLARGEVTACNENCNALTVYPFLAAGESCNGQAAAAAGDGADGQVGAQDGAGGSPQPSPSCGWKAG